MNKDKDYTFRGWLLTLGVTLGVVALGLLPAVEVFGLRLERVDALSALKDTHSAEEVVEYEADMARLEEELAAMTIAEEAVIDTLPVVVPTRYDWVVEDMASEPRPRLTAAMVRPDTTQRVIAIEDFDSLPNSRFERLVERLAAGKSVRIAFMGDSFVEGDILTCDLRSELQQLFGGRGVGFVPCDIPFATVRRSVKRRATNWSSYSIMKPKSAPERLRDKFSVSGYLSEGGARANVRWESVDMFPTLDSCSNARILLISRDSSSVQLTINDTIYHRLDIAADERLREIHIEAPIHSLAMEVVEGKVVCYGASLESDGGVVVDNFSVRSNNGHAIFGTSAAINRQVDEMLGYDMVVLQYGLNIMLPGQRNFSKYRDQLRDMIAYVERCFPNAVVLVMGVSDRWIKSEETGKYVPIGSVDALTKYQRAAADSCNVAFWNTSAAMAELGGMPAFVSHGWAGGDYTHINYAGGKRVARALAAALRQPVYELLLERERVDSLREQERRYIEQMRSIGVSEVLPSIDNSGAMSIEKPVVEEELSW